MAIATFTINADLNRSLKVNDMLFFCERQTAFFGNGQYNAATSDPTLVGVITSINGNNIVVDTPSLSVMSLPGGPYYDTTGYQNPENYFMFFAKNAAIELARVKGYYASARFVNNSKEKAELFNVGVEVVRSSK
tara:strand:- start:1129 stop:1530 length:402 start_codon:yes stop_codon:yes gene_type:complete